MPDLHLINSDDHFTICWWHRDDLPSSRASGTSHWTALTTTIERSIFISWSSSTIDQYLKWRFSSRSASGWPLPWVIISFIPKPRDNKWVIELSDDDDRVRCLSLNRRSSIDSMPAGHHWFCTGFPCEWNQTIYVWTIFLLRELCHARNCLLLPIHRHRLFSTNFIIFRRTSNSSIINGGTIGIRKIFATQVEASRS